MPLKNGRTSAQLQTVLIGSILPPGTVAPFAGQNVPEGWLFCNGQAISRTTYGNLFTAIGVAYGSGDGSTTFNLPDYRGQFIRGKVDINTINGSGTASANAATFTSHGVNRTGFKVRLSSGTLTGLAIDTDYFAIVVDANTLAFATSRSNALSNTRIAISGSNTAIIVQYEDADASNRVALNNGGNSGNNIGAVQDNAMQIITGSIAGTTYQVTGTGSGAFTRKTGTVNNDNGTFTNLVQSGFDFDSSDSIGARTSQETRPNNVIANYIIKV